MVIRLSTENSIRLQVKIHDNITMIPSQILHFSMLIMPLCKMIHKNAMK